MAKLDRKRPFGQVFGAPDHHYVQDGKKFDHDGIEVGGSEEPAPPVTKTKKSKGDDATDQVGAQLQE